MIITATDINANQKSIDKKVETEVQKYIKVLLNKKIRELKLKFADSNEPFQLSIEIKNQLKSEIIDSQEIIDYRNYQKNLQQAETNNLYFIRNGLQGLNELSEFSVDQEKNGLQTYDTFRPFDEINKLSETLNLKSKYIKLRNESITEYIKLFENKILESNLSPNDIYKNMCELYLVTKDYDDLELFEKFDMKSNMDFSNMLGEYYLHSISNQTSHQPNLANQNVIETEHQTSISKLIKKTIISDRLFAVLLLNGEHTHFVTNNSVTCYKSMYSTTKNNKQTYVTRTLGELLLEITNPNLQYVSKEDRQQIYSTYDGTRPFSTEYYKWNGLQVFDIDLKEWNGNIYLLKKRLFEQLSDYHWFLWIAISASSKGIHIYTKVTPPHHVYSNLSENDSLCKYWHQINYASKVNIIYSILKNTGLFAYTDFNEYDELKYLDNVVRRITAGVRLTYDNDILVNENFVDLPVSVGLQTFVFKNGKSDILRKIESTIEEIQPVVVSNSAPDDMCEIDLSKYKFTDSINQITPLDKHAINYISRYNVCNTLASLYGKDGISIAHELLRSKECGNVSEINSFYSCALSNKKGASKLGLEILKKAGIIKQIKSDIKEYADNKFKNTIRKAIEKACINDNTKATIELKPNQYLSDASDYLLDSHNGGFTNSKINVLLSPPGSGKTNMLLTMAKQGKRILLVEPFISVIKNKVETDSKLMKIFDVFYGEKRLDQLEYGVNAITTFDKFSICNYEKVSRMFDYICIDESHLLFTSSYRIEATSSAVRKIKELFYISNNDPFAAKIILMTGTETGDSYFFGDIANVITVTKPSLEKQLEFLICDDSLDAVTRLSYHAYKLIEDGYRLLIPTNKGEIYSHKLIGMVNHLLGREVKFGYYKRSNIEQDICRLINEHNTVGDYEIIFCSNYLSVGVDIIDKLKFASLYFGPFSGYEIEQFNARIRRTGIRSVYCIQTETNDGTTNDLLLEEPNLVLKITDTDIEHFKDDKEIAKSKQEFIAQYDPVLHKIVTPGFSYLNGAIRFNKEEYELISFETKFLETMVHPVKVARELSKYGYQISVSNEYDGLPVTAQDELKQVGSAAAKNEKIRKHDLLIGTYLALLDSNTYVSPEGLEFVDIIAWIGKHRDLIVEDRTIDEYLKIEYNIFAVPQSITVKSKEAFESMYGYAKYMITKYTVKRAKDIIMQYMDDNGILKQKHFKRAINLLRLLDKADSNELSEPVFKTIENMYDWLDKFAINKNYRISYNTYQSTLEQWTNNYIDMLGIHINSEYGFQKIRDSIIEMLNDLSLKNTTKEGIRFEYNRLPDIDSESVKYHKSIDSAIENMFNITMSAIESSSKTKRINKNHIILVQQDY